jgi:transposase
VFDGSDVVTMLFGIDGMRVRAQAEIVDEWWLKIETAPDVVGCTGCGTRAVGHGRRRVKVRDLPVFGRPVVLVWAKRIWRCPDPDCATKTWTEQHPAIGPRQALTERARFEICRLVGADGWSVARAARAFGVGWHCAWAAVVDHGTPLINDPARTTGVSSLGVDETRFLARKRNRATVYVTGLVDLDRRLLLDVAIGRSGKVVTDWLEAQPLEWRQLISVAAIDAFGGLRHRHRQLP